MLSIGEFSFVCKVSTKTLRYYEKIGLIFPKKVEPENGYRYYAIEQLETMRFINRLKSYNFTLEEIKMLLDHSGLSKEMLYAELFRKKQELKKKMTDFEQKIEQIGEEMSLLQLGQSIIPLYEEVDIQYAEISKMHLLSIRKMVRETKMKVEYQRCFGQLVEKIEKENLTIIGAPLVLFHDSEFRSLGLDTEFAIPIQEVTHATRYFTPGLCLKTILYGSYTELSSVYAKQINWADREGYECSGTLFEIYVTNLAQVANEMELVTEIYYPIKKR